MSRNDIPNLMFYLEKARVINQFRDDTKGIKLLGKVNKVYLSNINLAYAISELLPEIGNIRESVFFALMKTTQEVTSSSVADFASVHTHSILEVKANLKSRLKGLRTHLSLRTISNTDTRTLYLFGRLD